jgi:hypothetical protein
MSNRHTIIAFANEVAQVLHQRFRILDTSLLDPGYCMFWFSGVDVSLLSSSFCHHVIPAGVNHRDELIAWQFFFFFFHWPFLSVWEGVPPARLGTLG